MDAFESATVVIAGTALVLAPIDPQPIRDLNELAPPSTWEPTFDKALTRSVCAALGLRHSKPRPEEGETETRLIVWSQHELNDVYERVGGTVTTHIVERTACSGDAAWVATEITLTAQVPGVGDVQVITDWDEPSGGRDLSVMRQIADAELIAT